MIFGVLSNAVLLSRQEKSDFAQKRGNLIGSPMVDELSSHEHESLYQADYFPFIEVALSLRQPTPPLISISQRSKGPNLESTSVASSFGASNSDSIHLFSAGITPPTNCTVGRRSLEKIDSYGQSLSASPEQLRHAHRSNSNLATAFTSFSKPFSFNASASSSPPNALPRKQSSPNGSHVPASDANLLSRRIDGLSRFYNTTKESRLAAYNSQNSNKLRLSDVGKEAKFKVTLKNQHTFHNEGYAKVSLLDKVTQKQYSAYSEAYAYMLMVWQMPTTRTKILKKITRPTHSRSASKKLDERSTSSILIGRKSLGGEKDVGIAATLDVRRRCTRCGKAKIRDPVTGGFKCGTCAWKELRLSCVFCNERIRGYVIPCLTCSHVVHSSCRSYLSEDTSDVGQDVALVSTCVSGCGCLCSECDLPTVELPEHPQAKSSSPSTIREDDQEEQERQNEDRWEDVAYESLAKNLVAAGGRSVRPKTSRNWRGIERKQSDRG